MSKEEHNFQAEVRQLLDIVVHSLYSEKEVFIRELVSNASDALEKLRVARLTGEVALDAGAEMEITVSFDEEARTLRIADTGIGMSREEVIENLGTIAHSGTKAFLEAVKNAQGNTELIGQFGVGFYSSFMVADKVEVVTRSAREGATGVRWVSDGTSGYTVDDEPEAATGTAITIYLKEECAEFSKKYRVEGTLRRYSNFVSYPIVCDGERLNTVQAIWSKSKSEVTAEEYAEFYKFIAHTDEEALTYMHFGADAPININALLYVPRINPEAMGFGRTDANVSLYCKRVLIDGKLDGLLPEWLRFLHGVVDSEDLPLNVSREMLQDSALVRKINDVLTKRFLKHLDNMSKNKVEEYAAFYAAFARFIKEGVVTAWPHKEALGNLLRFESTMTEPGATTSFAEYITRMKEDQKGIYVLTGHSRSSLESSPYLEAFRVLGYEVAFFCDHGDQFVLDSLSTFAEKAIISADKADIELPDVQQEGDAMTEEEATALSEWMQAQLSGKFSKVTLGKRLVSGAAMALHSAEGLSPEVRAYLKAMGQEVPECTPSLELNPTNAVIKKLATLRAENPELAELVATQIANTALLRAGLLDDPTMLADSSTKLLEKML